jgi:phosphonate transport system substrate-binding protein
MSNAQPDPRDLRKNYPTSGSWVRWILFGALLVAIGFAADSARQVFMANADNKITEQAVVHSMGLTDPTPKALDASFTDTQGRLLADPPAADKLVDPQTIVVAHLPDGDAESPNFPWAKFEAHLADATGRKVSDMIYDNGPDQLALIKKDGITLVALHAADAPFLVNNYGYEPAAVLGDEGGASGNHLDIVVPANSGLNATSDLKAHTVVCTVPSSITGYRALVAMMMDQQNLRPNVDYFVTWSLGQKKSIEGVAKGEYEAAAISDDKLQSLVEAGDVAKKDLKIIYQSDVIPRTTIGWFYNLKPELAQQIKTAILSFKPQGAAPAADEADVSAAGEKPLHFIPIEYKKDFQFVRQIDDRFDPRLDAKTNKVKSADAAATQPL